ncbi:MAG: hypothetical protein RhofKO_40440 [Rhodothermales bacterium]
MEQIVPYAIYLVLALIGLGLLAMAIFGLRNVAYGKVKVSTMLVIAMPFLIFAGLGFAMGDWASAGIYALLIMLAFTLLALVLSSVRGIFT